MRTFDSSPLPLPETVHTDDFPLRVVPDWDEQVADAEEACRLIDRHLDHEARGRLLTRVTDFRPEHLCPEQRVAMVTDLQGAAGRAQS